MHLDLSIVSLMTLTTGVGWLMIQAGVFKNMLERRGSRRICPSCGRNAETCGCGLG